MRIMRISGRVLLGAIILAIALGLSRGVRLLAVGSGSIDSV